MPRLKHTPSIQEIRENKTTAVYIYEDYLDMAGDNALRWEDNCFGIPTKKQCCIKPIAYWSDSELAENQRILKGFLKTIPLDNRKIWLFPEFGEKVQMEFAAPLAKQTFAWLINELEQII